MKNYFKVSGLGLMAALTLVGCSSEDMSDTTNESNNITFSSYAQKSRVAITNSNITNYQFGVVGYNNTTGAAFLCGSGTQAFGTYGTRMEYKGEATGTWGNVYSNEAKEWPSGYSLNFIACAPIPKDATEGITPVESGKVGATFEATAYSPNKALTIDSWIPPYTDVMYATAIGVTSPDARPAELKFKHLLTQLGSFNAKLLQNGYRVELAKVQILGAYTLGTITIPLVEDPSTDASHPIQYTDKHNLSGVELSLQLANAKPINWSSNDPCADDGSNGVSLLKDLNSFIIPPTKSELWYYSGQETDGTRPAVGEKLALKLWIRVYKLAEGENPEKLIFPTDSDPQEELTMSSGKVVYGETWVPCVNKENLKDLQAGHRYTFNLNFKYTFGYTDGSDGNDPKPHYFDNNIKFNVDVDDWTDDVINITI